MNYFFVVVKRVWRVAQTADVKGGVVAPLFVVYAYGGQPVAPLV